MQSHIEVQPDGEIEIDEKVVKRALTGANFSWSLQADIVLNVLV
jgi:hypothetical protein